MGITPGPKSGRAASTHAHSLLPLDSEPGCAHRDNRCPKAYVAGHCGTTYTMDVRFTGWCSFRAGCYVPQEENGLTVCPNWHTLILDDPYFHWVAFPEPVPERVKEAIRKLRNPPVGR